MPPEIALYSNSVVQDDYDFEIENIARPLALGSTAKSKTFLSAHPAARDFCVMPSDAKGAHGGLT